MSIKLETVKADLEANKWTLLSTEYKNLKTPLRVKCPNGHEMETTYEEWRHYKRCEECLAADPYRQKKSKAKTEGTTRILALDGATNTTGYSIYDGTQLIRYGTFTARGDDITKRINEVKYWVKSMLEQWKPDFVGLEHIQLQMNTYNGAQQVEVYRKLANLQGVLMDALYEEKANCGLVYPTEWRKFCGVSGKSRDEQKKNAQAKAMSWYELDCTEDEADAICIGKYFSMNHDNKRNNFWGEKASI